LGAKGFEGRKITKKLRELGYRDLYDLDRSDKNDMNKIVLNADLVISTTGQPDLIKPDMIKEGVILIDVGSPRGDISKGCYEKAAYVSPVPGGIGPVTISYLLENIVRACRDI
jgi:methylenetetrahydrofolate dehydrogenase (NADP+)/methenyltetrahydrofolate cyclohydrolase